MPPPRRGARIPGSGHLQEGFSQTRGHRSASRGGDTGPRLSSSIQIGRAAEPVARCFRGALYPDEERFVENMFLNFGFLGKGHDLAFQAERIQIEGWG